MDEIQKTASQVDTDKHMVLRTEGLVKRYGKRTVANGVTINVKQGEIVGLLGPNGAGKTTSFYMTTGLVVPNAGHVYLDDQDITGYPVYKRARAGIGYLPQEASVFRKMSVEDNILSVLEMTGKPREYQMEKLESLINDFDLQKVRKNLGDQLSGGERRRTEIARCLANDPKFIMLDEPFAGVDPIQVEEIQNIVWRLKYRNIGILITDHNVDETLAITDRAYLLFEGPVIKDILNRLSVLMSRCCKAAPSVLFRIIICLRTIPKILSRSFWRLCGLPSSAMTQPTPFRCCSMRKKRRSCGS